MTCPALFSWVAAVSLTEVRDRRGHPGLREKDKGGLGQVSLSVLWMSKQRCSSGKWTCGSGAQEGGMGLEVEAGDLLIMGEPVHTSD